MPIYRKFMAGSIVKLDPTRYLGGDIVPSLSTGGPYPQQLLVIRKTEGMSNVTGVYDHAHSSLPPGR